MRRFRADAVCCLIVLALGLALGLSRYRHDIDFGDEGFLAYGAVRVMEGQLPCRDFVTLQPPLSFYSVAATFKILGTSLVSLRVLGLALHLAIALLVYVLTRQLARPPMALAAALPATVLGLPYFCFVPSAVWHGVVAALVAAFCALRAAATERRGWAVAGGIATMLTILSRQDLGFYLLIALAVFILALRFASKATPGVAGRRLVSAWAASAAALAVPLGLYWTASGALPFMFRQLVWFPLTRYAETSSLPMPRLGFDQPPEAFLLALLFYLPPAVVGVTAIWLLVSAVRKRFRQEHARVGFIAALSLLFYVQVLVRSDVFHLMITLAPFFVLCGCVLDRASGLLERRIGKLVGSEARWTSCVAEQAVLLVAVSCAALFVWFTAPILLPRLDPDARTLSIDRGGVFLSPGRASGIESVKEAIQYYAEPDRSILCLPYQPMFYFLAERRNPTRWNYIWPGDQSEEDHRALIEQAREDPPAIVVVAGWSEVNEYAPAILGYVNFEYKLAYDLSDMAIYLPKQRGVF